MSRAKYAIAGSEESPVCESRREFKEKDDVKVCQLFSTRVCCLRISNNNTGISFTTVICVTIASSDILGDVFYNILSYSASQQTFRGHFTS